MAEKTERMRQRQAEERRAVAAGSRTLRQWKYVDDFGDVFTAIAQSESGAYRVLNAERPGVSARYRGMRLVPLEEGNRG